MARAIVRSPRGFFSSCPFQFFQYSLLSSYLNSSSVSLSYFILTDLIRKCLGKRSCIAANFLYTHPDLIGPIFFAWTCPVPIFNLHIVLALPNLHLLKIKLQ